MGGLVLTLAITASLFTYKWSASLATVRSVYTTGLLVKPIDRLSSGEILAPTLFYFRAIWPALLFGVLIGGSLRAFISPKWVRRILGERPIRQQLVCALAGAPLMLCSCCATPIFTSVYERGARLGPALGVMLASPGLNVAALVLTFFLFPLPIALARLGLALLTVLGLAALVGRIFESPTLRGALKADGDEPADEMRSGGAMALRLARSIGTMALVTVPLIVVGVLLSSLALPMVLRQGQVGGLTTVAMVSLIAVLVALPTFFEIPLALLLIKMGAPAGAAVALLFAGPIINLPSLFVLARETRPAVAVALAGGIFLFAVTVGAVFTP